MKELARNALKQLLRQADRKVAGVAKKMPSLTPARSHTKKNTTPTMSTMDARRASLQKNSPNLRSSITIPVRAMRSATR